MSLFRSATRQHRTPVAAHWGLAALVGTAAVPLAGWAGLNLLSGPLAMADLGMIGNLPARLVLVPGLGALAYGWGAMALSVALSLPLFVLCLATGWAGWLTVALAGALGGGLAAFLPLGLAGPSAVLTGAISALALRGVLRVTCPTALAPRNSDVDDSITRKT